MGYQSFPWMAGDSKSYHKLLALQIPNLKDKSFLDVGCNEGYFCGYANFQGAKKVTGIDINPQFIAVAKALFPECGFICQNWNDLSDTKYDVILSASAIHYADDQKQLIDLLMQRVAPGGILVLEIGVSPGAANEFVEVKRSIDTRYFPTRSKLHEMLDSYAYKFISASAPQAGDPVRREVYHISNKLPYAILAMDDPHAGKTFTIDRIINADIRRFQGDQIYNMVRKGEIDAPDQIRGIIEKYGGSLDCGRITIDICRDNLFDLLGEWLAAWLPREDLVLDMFVPRKYRHRLAERLESAQYYVVNLGMQKAISQPRVMTMPPKDSAWRYYRYLQDEFMINEDEYLAANPDVANALKKGAITSALAHYIFHGRKEGRRRTPSTGSA